MQTLYTSADVERLGGEGTTELVIGDGELISPSALDTAREVGIEVRWASDGVPSDGPGKQREQPVTLARDEEPHPSHGACSCSTATGVGVDEQIERLVTQIAAERPDADEDEVVSEALRLMGADPLRTGVGSAHQAVTVGNARLPVKAKGARPVFLDDESLEWVTSIVMSLANEVWVLYERVDTLERLLADAGVLNSGDVDAYRPDADVAGQRDVAAQAFVAKILRVFQEARAETLMGETREGYMAVVRRAYNQVDEKSE